VRLGVECWEGDHEAFRRLHDHELATQLTDETANQLEPKPDFATSGIGKPSSVAV